MGGRPDEPAGAGDDSIDLGPMPPSPPPPPSLSLSRHERIELERQRARRARDLAAKQRRMADVLDGPLEPLRRRAATVHDEAADAHERAADRIERSGGGH